MSTRSPSIAISAEVQQALVERQPVVALESTIITHGMPSPENLSTALRVEETVRQAGATPATIAVLNGTLTVGLSGDQLAMLAATTSTMKLSRADLAWAMTKRVHGSTTVAATMLAAARMGIRFFATGGIGGVHRNWQNTLDISADLPEFSQSAVTVVSAGCKAILDVAATLEYLETLGVPVIGWQTDRLPAFWSRDSGLPVSLRMDSANQFRQFLQHRRQLHQNGGILVANPIPATDEIPAETVEQWIIQASEDAQHHGIIGKALTPFLLSRINQLSNGQSLVANIELIVNNARLAAELATAAAADDSQPERDDMGDPA